MYVVHVHTNVHVHVQCIMFCVLFFSVQSTPPVSAPGSQQYLISPITGERVPSDKLEEHMKHGEIITYKHTYMYMYKMYMSIINMYMCILCHCSKFDYHTV